MERFRLPVLTLLLAIFLAAAPAALARHWEPLPNGAANMTLLIGSATIDGNSLVQDDEIAAICPDGFVGGTDVVGNMEEGVGIAAWGDQGDAGRQGFNPGEEITFRVWDHNADAEWVAEPFDIEDWTTGEPQNVNAPIVYRADDFYVLSLRAFREGPAPDIQVNAGEVDFGHVRVGRSAEWILHISNVGREVLNVSNIAFETADFSCGFEQGFAIEAGASRDFTVTFAPRNVGNYNQVMTITSDSPSEEEVVVQLVGVGDEPFAQDISLSVENRNFGRVAVGASRNLSFFVINNGDLSLDVSNVTVNDNSFTTDFDQAFSIAGGERREVVVTFTPQAAAQVNATLTVSSNDPDSPEFDLPLSGEGFEGGDPEVGVMAAEHFYGKVVAGRTAGWRLAITNIGGSDLTITGVSSNSEFFTESFNINSYRLRPGDVTYVNTAFAPNAAGFFDGIFTITSNDPANGSFEVPVSGVGDADNGRHFQYYRTASSHNLLVSAVTRNNNALGAGNEIAVVTPGGFIGGAGVVGGDGRTGVTAWGDDEATDIVDGFVENDGYRFLVYIAATGQELWATPDFVDGPDVFTANSASRLTLVVNEAVPTPDLEVNAAYFSFGQVQLGDPEMWGLRISNRGAGNLVVSGIDADLPSFRTNFNGEFTLATGEAREITVTADPEEIMEYNGRLSISSNDPMDPVFYVDLFALGVSERREPTITLGAVNHFFGALSVGAQNGYTLRVNNTGGGLLQVTNVAINGGNGAFATNWGNQQVNLDPGEGFDLGLTFHPGQAGTFQATISITSDDPNANVVTFLAEGDATAEGTHFHARRTDVVHQILVEEAMMETPGGEGPFGPGDEVAIFTPAGLCAGRGIVEEAGVAFAIDLFGDNRRTEVLDGFINGEAFTYLVFDASTNQVIISDSITVEYLEGPETFSGGSMTRINVGAFTSVQEAQIAVDPNPHSFGAIALQTQRQQTFQIQNTGGVELTITGVSVELPRNFGTNYDGGRHVIQPGDFYELVVTYHPIDAQTHESRITIQSNDPDEPNFSFNVGGSGSNQAGHYHYVSTADNVSILVQSFRIGGVNALVGDELGVFTPAGIVAGSAIVGPDDVGEQVGLAAWGDDAGTDVVVEGFEDRERMSFRVWDSSQQREYDNPQVTLVDGSLNFEGDLTTIEIDVEGVVVAGYERNPRDGRILEMSEITVTFSVANSPGGMHFTCDNLQHFDDLGDVSFQANDNNQTAAFSWTPNYDASGNHVLEVSASNGEVTERVPVSIVVLNDNRAPEVVNPLQGDQIAFDEDAWRSPQDSLLIFDCWTVFEDPDREDPDNALTFTGRFVQGAPQGAALLVRRNRAGENPERVRVKLTGLQPNFNGNIVCEVTADDRHAGERDEADRGIRSLDGTPTRDDRTGYQFTIVINSINDTPVIDLPRNANDFAAAFPEDRETILTFRAVDADHAANQLRWTMTQGNVRLPDAARFVDAQNGTATLTWTPTGADVGPNYNPVFTVVDPIGAQGNQNGIDVITANFITVTQTNDNPVRNDTPFPVSQDHEYLYYVEDQLANPPPTPILRLGDYFDDEEDADANFRYDLDQTAAAVRNGFGARVAANNDDGGALWLYFQFQADYNTHGNPVNIVIRCMDRQNGTTSSNLPAAIDSVNDAPRVANVAEINFPARTETNAPIVGDIGGSGLVTKFFEPDTDAVEFTFEGDTQELGLSVNNPNPRTIHFNITANYNTARLNLDDEDQANDSAAVIVVRATDPAGLSATRTFMMKIRPDANDPITADGFTLLEPANNGHIAYEDSAEAITFRWNPAMQNPWEIDPIIYHFSARLQAAGGDSLPRTIQDTTEVTVAMQDLIAALHIGDRASEIQIFWRVYAVDRAGVPLGSQSGNFSFFIPALEIKETLEGAPMEFFLSNSYPNPFNARTTMKFGMPMSGDVSVSVWDMHGRKVAELAAGFHQAGTYELTWTADGVTSGVYIIKMQAGSHIAMQKAILVR